MKNLLLFRFKDKRLARIGFILVVFIQFYLAYRIYSSSSGYFNFAHIMLLVVIVSAILFSFPVSMVLSFLGSCLMLVAYQVGSLDGEFLSFSLINFGYLVGISLIIGSLKTKIENFYQRKESIFFIDEFSKLPNMSAFTRDIEEIKNDPNIQCVRILFAQVSNQYEISAAFGLHVLYKMQAALGKYAKEYFKADVHVYQIQSDTMAIFFPINMELDINELLQKPRQVVVVDDIPIFYDLVCGGVEFPRDGTTTDVLIQKGFLALQEAYHRNRIYFEYHPTLQAPQKIQLLGQIQEGMKKKEIIFYYQPILGRNGSIHNIEALVRWDHPRLGMLSPSEFIPDLELTGIANDLIDYSLAYNLEVLRKILDQGFNMDLAINVSITNLQQLNFTEKVIAALEKWHIPPQNLILEITERGFLADSEESNWNIENLSQKGVSFHIDDFGVGFTSIGNLRKFRIRSIKIDRSFIVDLPRDQMSNSVVECVISMAKAIGIETVAEGIESCDLIEPLKEMGIDYFQGYAISKPLSYKDLISWMHSYEQQ